MKADTPGRTIELADGRRLGYLEAGPPDGLPMLYFHGLPGSRLQLHPDRDIIEQAGIRLITVDRPGMGLSTWQPHRRILDWPADVAALADHLQLERFAVLGVSGGCPYALATVHQLADRVLAAGIVSGMGPLAAPKPFANVLLGARAALFLARFTPWLLKLPVAYIGWRLTRKPEWCAKRLVVRLPPSDLRIAGNPAIRTMFQADFAEAIRQGTAGILHETVLLARPWGFDPADLTPACPVLIWHGTEDTIVSPNMAGYFQATIPNNTTTLLTGEGHYLVFDHFPAILADIRSAAQH